MPRRSAYQTTLAFGVTALLATLAFIPLTGAMAQAAEGAGFGPHRNDFAGSFQNYFCGIINDADRPPGQSLIPTAPPSAAPFLSTLLGRNENETGALIVRDSSEYVYVVGTTGSPSFPTTAGAYDRVLNGWLDIFLVKLHPNMDSLIFATLLGGNDSEMPSGVFVDPTGIYVGGYSYSSDFPTTPGAHDLAFGGMVDGFVAKFSLSGATLNYSTFLGGSGDDEVFGFAVDATGNPFLAGTTNSTDFPTTPGAHDRSLSGTHDGFVTRLKADGSGLEFSTYLGGGDVEFVNAMTLNQTRAVIAGRTSSVDLPTTPGAYDRTHNGMDDGFVTEFAQDGSSLVYSTYIGGGDSDVAGAVVAESGSLYLGGTTNSPGFPTTPGAFDRNFAGPNEGFVAKINGTSLLFSTYLGGDQVDSVTALAVAGGEAFIAGQTDSSNFPTTPGAYDISSNGGQDGFVTRLSATGGSLLNSTFLGGSDNDFPWAILALPAGGALVGGCSYSPNFPTSPGAYDQVFDGALEAFVTFIELASTPPPPDNWPPYVVSTTPANGSVNVSISSSVVIRWNESMDQASAQSAFSSTPAMNCTFSWNGNDQSCVPAGALQSNTTYSVTLATTARDPAGNQMTSPYSIGFTTSSSTPAPAVNYTRPADNDVGILLNWNIMIFFSLVMDRAATEAAVSVSPSLPSQFSWASGDTILVLDPASDMASSTKYMVTIAASAKSKAGVNLPSPYIFTFTTILTGPPPTVLATQPPHGATNVALTVLPSITFSRAMDRVSVESALSASPAMSGTFAWTGGDTRIEWRPASSLTAATVYTIMVSATAKASDGAAMGASASFAFGTENPRPSVISTVPSDGATNVGTNNHIYVRFNVPMDRTSVEVSFSSSPALTGAFYWYLSDTQIELFPQPALAPATTYTVTMAGNARSKTGVAMNSPHTFSFRTSTSGGGGGADITPPSIDHMPVSSTSPDVDIPIVARVTDDVGVPSGQMRLYYRTQGRPQFSLWPMSLVEGTMLDGKYTGTIPRAAVTGEAVEYYFQARDAAGNADLHPDSGPAGPHVVEVVAPGGWNQGSQSYVLYGAAAAAIAAFAVALFLLRRRRRGREADAPPAFFYPDAAATALSIPREPPPPSLPPLTRLPPPPPPPSYRSRVTTTSDGSSGGAAALPRPPERPGMSREVRSEFTVLDAGDEEK